MHYVGLVVLTPDFIDKGGDIYDALEAFDENKEAEPYCQYMVGEDEKLRFVRYYKDGGKPDRDISDQDWYKEHPDALDDFEELYAEHGYDWNLSEWKKDEGDGEWYCYSTYNQESRYDWFVVGGRWEKCIQTKSGENVNFCNLEDIDFSEYSEDELEKEEITRYDGTKCRKLKEDVHWRINNKSLPYFIVVDGEWYDHEEFEDDTLDKFFEGKDPESEVYIVDIHM